MRRRDLARSVAAPYPVLKQKAAVCQGLATLLTDKIDAELLDAAPKLRVISNYAVGFNNIDIRCHRG